MNSRTKRNKDGGPAFACAAENGHQEGMALRDYFAAAAMQGDCANSQESVWRNDVEQKYLNERAALYYRIADAMLAERSK